MMNLDLRTPGSGAIVSQPGQGGLWGGLGCAGFVGGTTSNGTPISVNGQVRFVFFVLQAKVTISKVTMAGGVTAGTGDVGIYDANGNLLANTGPVTYANNTFKTSPLLQGSVTLEPGVYIFAYGLTSSTAQWFGFSVNTHTYMQQYGSAANGLFNNALQATLGVLTIITGSSISIPAAFFQP